MRRGFSISLVLLLLLAPLASWLPGVDESNLPMCCRRHGSHHCAASPEEAGTSGGAHAVATSSRCPNYGSTGPATLAAFLLPVIPTIAMPRQGLAPSLPAFQAHRTSLRTVADRGPPSAC